MRTQKTAQLPRRGDQTVRAMQLQFPAKASLFRCGISGDAPGSDPGQCPDEQIRNPIGAFRSGQQNEHRIAGTHQHADAVGEKIQRPLQISGSEGQPFGFSGCSGRAQRHHPGDGIQRNADKPLPAVLEIPRRRKRQLRHIVGRRGPHSRPDRLTVTFKNARKTFPVQQAVTLRIAQHLVDFVQLIPPQRFFAQRVQPTAAREPAVQKRARHHTRPRYNVVPSNEVRLYRQNGIKVPDGLTTWMQHPLTRSKSSVMAS